MTVLYSKNLNVLQIVKDLKNSLLKFAQQEISKRMANREVEAPSYFARIAQANKMAKNDDVILDYWPLFPFQTQTRIKEYLVINYPKRYKLNVIAHCKLGDILNVYAKRRLLEGLEKIPDMFAVVYEVKR